MKQHLRGFSLSRIGLLLLPVTLFFLSGCIPTVTPPPTPIVVTATPEPAATVDLEATIAALATEIAGKGNPPDPPVVDPPAPEPPASDTPTATPTTEPPPPVPPPPDPPTSTPTIAIPHGIVTAPVSVNVRSGPDTEYPIARVSARGTRLEVVGRSLDGEWWQVRVPDIAGGVGWVSTIYLETQNTANVPVVSAPPLPPTITPSPTATRRPAPPPPPPPNPGTSGLDLSAAPYFGSHTIYPTFDNRTVNISVTGGGSINVRDAGLPSQCTGYVSSAPDVEIDLRGGTDLYLYFVSGSDATLIVNDPYGNWYCDDDSYGGGSPMVIFRGAATGIYDIWVGRYGSSGTTQPGTLYIGEMHP